MLAVATIIFIIILAASSQPKSLIIKINGTEYRNGSSLDWGNMTVGTYNVTYQITNYTSQNQTFTLTPLSPPKGTFITLTGNNTVIMPRKTLSGTISMTVTPNAVNGEFNYTLNFNFQG